MKQAIALARKGLGRTAPNPPVGALIVKNSKVIGKGFHPKAGLPHAEVFALEEAGEEAKGATLYVTLEPCTHFGKTPPCVDAIIRAGIKKVAIGVQDPNPVVTGQGIERLKTHGIEVNLGIASGEAAELIRWYEKWMRSSTPYVILKVAMTLDGKIATTKGDSKWITSEASREIVHELRDKVDAVLVGIGTVLADDPQLTCRISGGRDPVRVIVDKDYMIPVTARCLGEKCLVFTSKDPKKRKEILNTETKVVKISPSKTGRLSWDEIFSFLGKQGMHAVMIEGGSRINASVIRSRRVDQIMAFISPRLLGGGISVTEGISPAKIAEAVSLKVFEIKQIGGDILIDAFRGK